MLDIIQDPFGPEIIPHDLPNDRVVIIQPSAWAGQFGTVNGKIKANGAYRIAIDRDVQTAFDREEFVVLKKRTFRMEHPGMKVCMEGLIKNAVACIPKNKDTGGYRWMLTDQLLKHLQELGDRYYAGDEAVVDEFLQLYCLDRKRQKPLDIQP